MHLAHHVKQSAHPHTHHGLTIGTPRLYDFTVELLSLGRRRSPFRRLVQASGVQPGHRVLDVGSGTGYFSRLLADAVGPSGSVVGIDAAPEMVAYATRQARSRPNCRFEVGSAESLPFADASFDVVVTSFVIHHLPQDMQLSAVREMRRVLQQGGRLLIAEVQMPRSGLYRLPAKLMGLESMARHVPPLEPLATEAGFTRVAAGEAAPWMRYIQAYT
jgi:ubiquinone/menaquinone biosynthesis C-methylase UbiE